MSEMIQELNSNSFSSEIEQGLVLVDFWAPWCGPCNMQTPILESVAAKAGERMTVAKVNVDDSQDIAMQFGVQSIPTLILLKDGEEVRRFVGVQSEKDLLASIETVG